MKMSLAQQRKKLKLFAESSGFMGFTIAKTINEGILGFRYDSFDPKAVRKHFKLVKHTPSGMFLFKAGKNRSIRVDTINKVVLLADGVRAADALSNSFKG